MEVVILNSFRLFFLVFAFALVSLSALADTISYEIKRVEVDCRGYGCEYIEENFQGLERENYSLESLREKSRFLALNDRISNFSFTVHKTTDDKLVIRYRVMMYPRISSINFDSNIEYDFSEMGRGIFRSGGVYNPFRKKFFIDEVQRRVSELGMKNIEVNVEAKEEGNEIDLNVFVSVGKILRLQKINIETDSKKTLNLYRNRIRSSVGEFWDQVSFRVKIDQILSELSRGGYYDASITYTDSLDESGENVLLDMKVNFGTRYQVSFKGNHIYSRSELLEQIQANLASNLGEFDESFLEGFIEDFYEDNGFYDTEVSIRTVEGVNRDDIKFKNFYINIKEGKKLRVESLSFIGNSALSDERILEMYKDHSTVMAKRKFLDRNFKNRFRDIIKEEYLSRGFVFAEVDNITVNRTNDSVDIEYRIRERQQVVLTDIKLENVPDELAENVKEELANKISSPINIVELQRDFRKVSDYLRDQGYYFARIRNINEDSVLNYSSNLQEVEIYLDVNLGKVSYFDGALVSGLEKTHEVVINREIKMERKELFTPSKVDQLRRRLNFLGLFSSIEITPFVINRQGEEDYYLVNLLIQVEEKDFGSIELAPGFRTDIGVKFSTDVSYNNLWGMNRAISLRTEVNQRLDFANLDSRRRDEEKRMLEFAVRGNYSEPYLFNTGFQFDLGASYQRRRFFSFDADIRRFSPEISRSFGNHFAASLKYQFETIRQFDATELRDNDSFRIGSVIPTLALDFRDDSINPRRGAYFNLSWEYASPTFGSLESDDLVVNFHKLVSRNQFYIPMGDWTLASSLTLGYEQNLSDDIRLDEDGNPVVNESGVVLRKGFIPSIKVFRLDGIDTVRGFSDNEINRLKSGEEVGSVLVQDEAYFVNFKLEPRYHVTDQFMVGGFFDAGRVFIDTFQPASLRTSTGVTFKVVTPVGSLDFDYGIKMRRERPDDSGRESFGRFHLSIGHF